MDDASDSMVRFGPFELDLLRRELRTHAGVVALGSRAFDTLAELVRLHGETVDRASLMQAVWPGRVVEENNLTQAIKAIRHALSAHGVDCDYIVTVSGRGYRFIAPLHHARSGCRYALAVLPLHRVGGDPGDCRPEGYTDALIAALSSRTRMPVRSLVASAALPHGLDGVAAGRRLAVTHVVEGALQCLDDRMRLSLRVLETDTGRAPWSRVVDIADDPLALESIADEICARLPLDPSPGPTAVDRRRPEAS